MHGIGQWWVNAHHDQLPEVNDRRNTSACNACHGLNGTGGVLSQTFGPRTLRSEKGGTITYFEGQQVSCYDCHNGPDESDRFRQAKPTVANLSLMTDSDVTVTTHLVAHDTDSPSLLYRIVTLPSKGTISIQGNQIGYTPNPGFVGTDMFSYCARDNRTESNLGIASITVGSGADVVDQDGDGIADLIERAFGLSTARVNRGNAPDYKIYREPGGEPYLQATYNPKLIPADLNLVFEASGTLEAGSWDSGDPELMTITNTKGDTVVRMRLGADKHFLRCRVVQR
jgi:hypothetical protein